MSVNTHTLFFMSLGVLEVTGGRTAASGIPNEWIQKYFLSKLVDVVRHRKLIFPKKKSDIC